jgi:CubicO group peptidase (beta-lactamase class C family)
VFTVLEALIQQNQGRLHIEHDIREYIDEFRLFDNSESKLSLRQLGSHLSGLGRDRIPLILSVLISVLTTDIGHFPDHGERRVHNEIEIRAPGFCDPGSSDRSNGSRICSKDQILRAIASRPLAFEPWTRPLYSNTGFNLLGWATAEAYKRKTKSVSDQVGDMAGSATMEDLLRKDVFEPLDMKDSSFWVPEEKRDRVAVPSVPNFIDWDFTSTFNPYIPSLAELMTALEDCSPQPTI